MKMKTFQAESMQEALLKIKDELGPEAVILRTRKSEKKVLGKRREVFEITAALDESLFARPGDEVSTAKKSKSETIYTRSRVLGEPRSELPDIEQSSIAKELNLSKETLNEIVRKISLHQPELQALRGEIKNLTEKVSQMHHAFGQTGIDQTVPELTGLYYELRELGIEENLARELLGRVEHLVPAPRRSEQDHVRSILKNIVSSRLHTAEEIRFKPGRPKVVMLVGPTGAGKTTTIAKLCGIYRYERGKNVGVVSADAYKIGAREQMTLFCRTAGVPMEQIYSRDDAGPALKKLGDRDIIFVDTSGRAQNHPELLQELRELILEIEPDEIHLVLSCTMRTREMLHICSQYQLLGVNRLIFTKMDESLSLGCIYNIGTARNLPVSFLCNGQEIPDNILQAGPGSEMLASMVLDGQDEPAARLMASPYKVSAA